MIPPDVDTQDRDHSKYFCYASYTGFITWDRLTNQLTLWGHRIRNTWYTIIIPRALLFRGCVAYAYESPLGDSCLVMNLFMHLVTSQYVFMMLNNRISVATITYATASPCRIPLNGVFHQDSATEWNQLQIKKDVVSNSLGKRYLNSAWTQYVCDKSDKARVCVK